LKGKRWQCGVFNLFKINNNVQKEAQKEKAKKKNLQQFHNCEVILFADQP
jgi:hypothetical protein